LAEYVQHWHTFKSNTLVLQCHILPKSSVNQIVGLYNGRLKIKLTTAPTEGKANKALIKFLSKELQVPQATIVIEKGEMDHKKTWSLLI